MNQHLLKTVIHKSIDIMFMGIDPSKYNLLAARIIGALQKITKDLQIDVSLTGKGSTFEEAVQKLELEKQYGQIGALPDVVFIEANDNPEEPEDKPAERKVK